MSVNSERQLRRTAKPYCSPKQLLSGSVTVSCDGQWRRSNNKKLLMKVRHKNQITKLWKVSVYGMSLTVSCSERQAARVAWKGCVSLFQTTGKPHCQHSHLRAGLADALPPMKWLTLDGLTSRGNGAGQYQTAGIHWIPQWIIKTWLQGTAGFGGGWGIRAAKQTEGADLSSWQQH